MSPRLFVFGAGYSGLAVARAALSDGWHVAGTTRSPEKAQRLQSVGVEAHIFDGSDPGADMLAALDRATHLLVSVAPEHGMRDAEPAAQASGAADPVLAAAGRTIAQSMPELRWIGYLSTVGVYGDHDGAWVDEDGECRPSSQRSRMRLDAERAWLALASRIGVPLAILRLSGIYGPGRNAFVNLANGTARRIVKPGQVFNRIHVDDIAGATMHLAREENGGTFNVTDDEPAPPQDVVAYAASLMGVEPPPETAFDDAEMSPMARSFYGENKRVSNALLKETGYRFVHGDYRSAFATMWRDDSWRG